MARSCYGVTPLVTPRTCWSVPVVDYLAIPQPRTSQLAEVAQRLVRGHSIDDHLKSTRGRHQLQADAEPQRVPASLVHGKERRESTSSSHAGRAEWLAELASRPAVDVDDIEIIDWWGEKLRCPGASACLHTCVTIEPLGASVGRLFRLLGSCSELIKTRVVIQWIVLACSFEGKALHRSVGHGGPPGSLTPTRRS